MVTVGVYVPIRDHEAAKAVAAWQREKFSVPATVSSVFRQAIRELLEALGAYEMPVPEEA